MLTVCEVAAANSDHNRHSNNDILNEAVTTCKKNQVTSMLQNDHNKQDTLVSSQIDLLTINLSVRL